MAEKATTGSVRQEASYISAQLQKISHTLLTHQQQLIKIQEINSTIRRQAKLIHQLQQKIRLMEVYQSQNFKNNERLFIAHGNFDMIEKKITLLEQVQFKLINRQSQGQKHASTNVLRDIETRLNDVEQEILKSKNKNNVLAKFRRQMSPRLPNCESTKDISVENGSVRNQLKKMQKKMQQLILEKFSIFQRKYNAVQQELHDQQSLNELDDKYLDFTPNHMNRKTRVKNMNRSEQKIAQLKHQSGSRENYFKNQIESYYNQNTNKEEKKKKEKINVEQANKITSKQKHKNSKIKSTSHSRSSKKHKKKNSGRSSKKLINLSTVNQYLRIHDDRQ